MWGHAPLGHHTSVPGLDGATQQSVTPKRPRAAAVSMLAEGAVAALGRGS